MKFAAMSQEREMFYLVRPISDEVMTALIVGSKIVCLQLYLDWKRKTDEMKRMYHSEKIRKYSLSRSRPFRTELESGDSA